MTDKDKFMECWVTSLGIEGAEAAWKVKQEGVSRAAAYVRGDIQPYKSMMTGEMIEGRRQHRDHLRQHRLVEIGNEPIRESKPQVYNPDEVKREIARQLYT